MKELPKITTSSRLTLIKFPVAPRSRAASSLLQSSLSSTRLPSFNQCRTWASLSLGRMRLRIRGPSGQSTVTLDDSATVQTLKDSIQKETSLTSFDVKYGYPPKVLALDQWPSSKPLAEVGVRLNGEREFLCLRLSNGSWPLPFPVCRLVFCSKISTNHREGQS